MSEQKHNDALEEFFREKAQDYDIEYDEEDWNKLERRLDDAESNQSLSSWQYYLVAAAIAFLFSILAYVTYQQQLTINQLNERLTNSKQPSNTESQPWAIPNLELFKFDFTDNQSDQSAYSSSDAGVENKSLANKKEKEKGRNQQPNEIINSEPLNIALAQLSQQDILLASSKKRHINNLSITTMPEPNIPTSGDALTNIQREASPISSTNTQRNQATDRKSPFSVALMAGPDLSTVGGIADFYDPGYKIGLALEYRLSQNFSLSIGAVHSKVQYSARGNDYSPPQTYWGYGATPDETIAQCLIIDIPISLKYDFLQFNHSRVYASAGLSSYIMLNEDYQFRYDTNADSQPQRWQERTGTKHWMSNATFSLGYEIDLEPKISFRVEPFIKVPMRNVGWGQVKLYSMGSLASITYDF